jgi:hypothetical protein
VNLLIIDLNQVMISNVLMNVGFSGGTVDEPMLRHMVLNSIRAYNKKYKDTYGELVIACDASTYWRKEVFPYYKASRKKNRDASVLDWNSIFTSLNKIRQEIIDTFPYRTICVPGAEADDVISVLVEQYGSNIGQRLLILSGDKDFIQLQTYPGVDQFDPVRKKKITHPNPEQYLKEHIIKGDQGDGIPNILSPDDCFVASKRQGTLTKQRLQRILSGDLTEEEKRNWARNSQLIDMTAVPEKVKDSILESFNFQEGKPRQDLFSYFIKHKLKNLIESIGDF